MISDEVTAGYSDEELTHSLGSPGFDHGTAGFGSTLPCAVDNSAADAKPEPVSKQTISQKRKRAHEQILELTAADRDNQLAMASKMQRGKLDRTTIREEKRQKTAIDIEVMRIAGVREEAERNRKHELVVLDCKLELARLQCNIPPARADLSTNFMAGFGSGSGKYRFTLVKL